MIFLDIETNLAHDKIWLCVTYDSRKDKLMRWLSPTGLQEYLNDVSVCGHNIIGFDAPVLNRVWGITIPDELLVDTLVMARLYKPDIDPIMVDGKQEKHSLAGWGARLGHAKGNFTDFDSGFSEEMYTYCVQDVNVTYELFNHLQVEMKKFAQQSINWEHDVAVICNRMQNNGFAFDEKKAMTLQAQLSGRMADIENKMQEVFPPIVEHRVSEKTGKPLKDKTTVFNPGSRQQIADRLQGLGVVFSRHTEKGSIIVDEAVLETIDLPEAKLVSEYLMLQKRVAQINSWLELVGNDGRIHGRIITNGAVTGRCSHHSPNLAQVPAVGNPYGAECREMFIVPKRKSLVGVDLSGIELRCLSHYMQDRDWQLELLTGDIHWRNAQSFGLIPKGTIKDERNSEHKKARNITKTLTYAMLYGAGPAKIASTIGVTTGKAKTLIDNFLTNTPALVKLKSKIATTIEKHGTLPGLDGRQLWIRSQHAALNTLLQSAGAIIAKQWLIKATLLLKVKGIDAKLVAFVHDETQWEVAEEDADEAMQAIIHAASLAGNVLQFRCPVEAEGKIGNNWRECH
jgi:DNA polymerase I-like protein with 3'-5' exonuclease and polymerase domains